MVAQTITEKILASHAGVPSVRPGQFITARIDRVMAHDITGPLALAQLEAYGIDRLFDPERIVLVPDHLVPSPTAQAAQAIHGLRTFARRHGVTFFEVGRGGIAHILLLEEGLVAPGELVVGADSHTCTLGAVGAFATGLGSTDTAAAMATGEVWLQVPATIRVRLEGSLPRFVMAKDIMLALLAEIGLDGATYRALEFVGSTLAELDLDERATLCNMAVEAGAKNGIVPPDPRTLAYVQSRVSRPFTPVTSDPGADYLDEVVVRCASLEPLVAEPHSPAQVRPVSELEGLRVDQVFLGSCTNGKLTDLRVAASLLRGRRIAPHVRMVVTPATQSIYREALAEGLLDVFAQAGAVVTGASCGACPGLHTGVLGPGEVCLSTTNRNFRGRMGSPEARIYLANPAVGGGTALTGAITDPRRVVGGTGSFV